MANFGDSMSLEDLKRYLVHNNVPAPEIPEQVSAPVPPPQPTAPTAGPFPGVDPAIVRRALGIGGPASPGPSQPAVNLNLPPPGPPELLSTATGAPPVSGGAGAAQPTATPPAQTLSHSDAPVTSPGQVPTSGPDNTRPQTMLSAPPTDPNRVAGWAREQGWKLGQDAVQTAQEKEQYDRRAAQERSDEESRQAAIEAQAQAQSADRENRLRAQQDQAISRQRKMTQALVMAATDTSDLYPHPQNAHTAIGNALLALSTGGGANAAAQILIKSSEGDHEWDEMSVKRHQSLLDGLSRAASAGSDETRSIGGAMTDEASVNQAMANARLTMNLQKLQQVADSHPQDKVGLEARQAMTILQQTIVQNEQKAAEEQVKSYVQELTLFKAMHPVHAPTAPPVEPSIAEAKYKDMTPEAFNLAHGYWQSVEMPMWQTRMRTAGTGGGSMPRPPWEIIPGSQQAFAPSTVNISSPGRTNSSASSGKGKAASSGGGPSLPSTNSQSVMFSGGKNAPPSKTAAPAEESVTPYEKQVRDQFHIPFSGGTLVPLKGERPDASVREKTGLDQKVAGGDATRDDIGLYAELELATPTTIGDVLERHHDALGGLRIGTSDAKKMSAEALRGLIVAHLKSTAAFGEKGVLSDAEFKKSVAGQEFMNWSSDSPADVTKMVLNTLLQFADSDVTSALRVNRYDPAPWQRRTRDVQSLIGGMGRPVVGPKESSENQGSVSATDKREAAWGMGPGQILRRELGQEPQIGTQKVGDQLHAVNYAPANTSKDYQVIGDKQIEVDKSHREYLAAMDRRDWAAAHAAYNSLIKLKDEQKSEAKSLAAKFYGLDATGRVSRRNQTISEFLADLLRSNGMTLGN